jgi:Uma2 family endonuclease
MATETQGITADDLLRMPDDGFRYELVKGELIRMTPTGNVRGRVAGNVAISLGGHDQAMGWFESIRDEISKEEGV